MGLDIRLPIGIFFTILGVLLAVYGAATSAALYQKSLGIDVNLIWGVALAIFGALMWLFGRRGSRLKR